MDTEWNTVENSRVIQYTNLRGGDYQLQYQVSRDGVDWIDGLSTPVFTIHLPFWKRQAVQGSVVLLILGALYFAHTMRMRNVRRQQRVEEAYHKRLAELEMSALRAQMNPHFMFNALTSIRNFILKEDTESANLYLTKFARLMRTILHNSRSTLVSVDDELTALRLYVDFESMRFRDKINVEWYVDPSLDTQRTFLPPLIVQPYVENAIWHGLVQKNGSGRLNLRFERLNSHLRISVYDNGVGRSKAAVLKSKSAVRKKSYGMDITGHRIELINEMLNIESDVQVIDLYEEDGKSPCGTEVVITLPLIKDP